MSNFNRAKQDLMEVAGTRLSQIWRDQDAAPSRSQIVDTPQRVTRAFPALRLPDLEVEQVAEAFGRLYA